MDKRERRMDRKTLTAIYIVLVVLASLAAYSTLASIVSVTHFKADMTEGAVFKLTDTTKELLSGLDRDVDIIVLNNENDADTNVTELLGRYENASGHIKLIYKDLDLNPSFAESYEARGISLQNDGVIVECGSKARFIKWEELYRISTYTDASNNQNYVITGLAAEGQVSAAIAAVSSDDTVKVVFTAGHSEDTEGRLGELITGSGYDVSRCVLEVNELDEDTDAVLIAGARRDFSAAEISKLRAHLDRGGSLIVFRDPSITELPNLDALCAEWGLTLTDQIVLESSQYMGDPSTVIPVFGTSMINVFFSEHSTYVVLPTARCLELSQDGEGMVNAVLKSTSNSYSKSVDGFSSYERGESDPAGPFCLAATSERVRTAADGSEYSQYVFEAACTNFYTDVYLDTTSLGNADFVLQVLSCLTDSDISLNIPVKDLRAPNLALPRSFIVIFAAIFVIIIPIVILFYGIVRQIKRKRA